MLPPASDVKQSDKSFRVCNLAWRSAGIFPDFNRRSPLTIHRRRNLQFKIRTFVIFGREAPLTIPALSRLSLSLSPGSLRASPSHVLIERKLNGGCRSLIPGQYGLPSVNGIPRSRSPAVRREEVSFTRD